MPDNSLRDKIQNWLRGRLSDAEAAALQAQADTDPDFARLVEQERLYLEALELLFKKKLAANLARWRNDPENIPPPPDFTKAPTLPKAGRFPNLKNRKIWIILAAVGLGLLAWLIWREPAPSPPPQKEPIAQKQQPDRPGADTGTEPEDSGEKTTGTPSRYPYRPLAINLHRQENAPAIQTPNQRSDADTARVVDPADPAYRFRLAQDTLRIGNPGAAIELLQGLALEDSSAASVQLWLGHAWFDSGKFEEAIAAYRRFEQLTERTNYADWYLLLSYLAVYPQDKTEFDALLTKISTDPKHLFYTKANDLKNQLGRPGKQ